MPLSTTLTVGNRPYEIFSIHSLINDSLPFSLRILLENLVRCEDNVFVGRADIEALANWKAGDAPNREINFMPARVLMQDFTGVPAIVDLAAMRSAMKAMGGDAGKINPLWPTELVIDHSVQVDQFGTAGAFAFNAELEFSRNLERYRFLKWGQTAFHNFKVVPPDTGIVHQVNLENLARVVFTAERDGKTYAYPDTVVGTDSHTTMINGLGVLGWGVGGIEAEAAMLGQPATMLIPQVVGFKLHGRLPAGATATDLVLRVTEMLRKKGVVGKFVEFYGPGLSNLTLPDRATIANMAPEYGATVGFFPVDAETLAFLRFTGRDAALVDLVEAYCKEQGLYRTDETTDPTFTDTLALELDEVEPSLAGPRRPQDRVPLKDSKASFAAAMASTFRTQAEESTGPVPVKNGANFVLNHGSVVIAAITSCTNTSNPILMVGAGLLAKAAVERGMKSKPWVKTSLAPGSKVVTDYLGAAGLTAYLDQLGFNLVGYGCTTCIGNSGPLPPQIGQAVKDHNLVAVSVLSGNRNFEGRVNPLVRANYLASPPLVVAYALAGRMDIDVYSEPLGEDRAGNPVFLKEIWPSPKEVEETLRAVLKTEMFRKQYADVFLGDSRWQELQSPTGDLYEWDSQSTYIQQPPYFVDMPRHPKHFEDIRSARVLAVLGDSVTTDHISPAGSIPVDSPAGKYLISKGVKPADFNSYGARRGNHEVMMRGTWANIRLRNLLVPGIEGGFTIYQPGQECLSIYEAAMQYQKEGTPLVVIAGKEYGTGSSRDWAAKGTALLGVRAVIAESYERIHRSNLVGMGVLPLEFLPGETRELLGLTGLESYEITGLDGLTPRQTITVNADGRPFTARVRVDTPEELTYLRHGGILPYVLRQML